MSSVLAQSLSPVLLALNQVKFCELHACRPLVEWGMFPVCKYEGVRFPGRTPFYEKSVGANAFEYYFEQPCAGPPPQKGPPMLTCEQRELVHRQLPWAVRTYYYGAHDPQPEPGRNETLTYDEEWYGSHRMEAARLVRTYLKLQPHIRTKVEGIASQLLGSAPILGVHLRGTDKGKYLSARSGRRRLQVRFHVPQVLGRRHRPAASSSPPTRPPSSSTPSGSFPATS